MVKYLIFTRKNTEHKFIEFMEIYNLNPSEYNQVNVCKYSKGVYVLAIYTSHENLPPVEMLEFINSGNLTVWTRTDGADKLINSDGELRDIYSIMKELKENGQLIKS